MTTFCFCDIVWSVSGTETVQVSYCLFISVLSLEIELSEGV